MRVADDDFLATVCNTARRVLQTVMNRTSDVKFTSLGDHCRRALTVGPQPVVLVAPRAAVTIAPPPRPVWDDRGWTTRPHRGGRVYEGKYRVASATRKLSPFAGCIVEPPLPQTVIAYIADPPPELRQHPKGACFQLTQPPWFRVHWVRPAPTVDDAILYVERILAEALELALRRR